MKTKKNRFENFTLKEKRILDTLLEGNYPLWNGAEERILKMYNELGYKNHKKEIIKKEKEL